MTSNRVDRRIHLPAPIKKNLNRPQLITLCGYWREGRYMVSSDPANVTCQVCLSRADESPFSSVQ